MTTFFYNSLGPTLNISIFYILILKTLLKIKTSYKTGLKLEIFCLNEGYDFFPS